jgi:YD repeat-containing protein
MKKILPFLYFIVLTGTVNAQKIQYAYDDAGNRVKKEIALATKSSAEAQPSVFTEELAERTIRIYPNPTEGWLKVEVSDFEECKSADLSIVNMQGQVVLRKKMNSAISDLDISSKANGLYILLIRIDGENSSWKIIKK